VRELGREHTVVVSTHILSEVEACATRVVLIHQGRLVAQGLTSDIRAMRQAVAVDVMVRGSAVAADEALRGAPGVQSVTHLEIVPPFVRLRATFHGTLLAEDRPATVERIVGVMVGAGLGVSEVRACGGSLEDVFAELTQEPAGPVE
jgi:ABC-2 type transport system ATP-binding protein